MNNTETRITERANELRFTCSRKELLSAFHQIAHAVTVKAPLPVLEGILFAVQGDKLVLTAYDLQFGLHTSLSVEDAKEDAIVVPAKLFSEMVQSLNGDELTFWVESGNKIVLKCESATCRLTGEPAADFPTLPVFAESGGFSIPAKLLNEMLCQATFTGAVTYMRDGVLVDMEPDKLTLIGCDGVRLAAQSENISCGQKAWFLIPTECVPKIKKLLSQTDGEVRVSFDAERKTIRITRESAEAFFKAKEGSYFDYKNFLSMDDKEQILLPVKRLQTVLERCKLLKTGKKLFRVSLRFQAGQAFVSCKGDSGSIEDVIPCEYEGEEKTIAFDVSQFLSIMKKIKKETFTMAVGRIIAPVYMAPVGEDARWFILAPMHPEK